MHRCYFIGHQDEARCIRIFLLSLSENRRSKSVPSGKALILLSIFNYKVQITGLPQMIDNIYIDTPLYLINDAPPLHSALVYISILDLNNNDNANCHLSLLGLI